MADRIDIRGEMLKALRLPVPAILGVSALLGLFNAPEWTAAEVLPRITATVAMGALMCLFGLVALFIGLKVADLRGDLVQGWLAGLVVGFAGIAFMLWYYAVPAN